MNAIRPSDTSGSGLMNYKVNAVARSTEGYGFGIIDTHGVPLVHFAFEQEDKAKEAHQIIGQTIAIAMKITSQSR
jgi:hypothetical protein